MKILAFIFLLPVAMVAKMAKNRLKIEKLLFKAKFEAFGDRFLRIRYQNKQIPKKILCAVIILIIC